jgi:outer membrane lipoprotein
MKRLWFILIIIFFISGCAHVVSEELREQAAADISASSLLKDPDLYKGEIVILGGSIINSSNTQEKTYIEIIEKPLNSRGRPEYTDISHGRFIIVYEGFLDTAIFSKGRYVTVAGEVMGKEIRPLDEIDYTYLVIKSRELHLLEPGSRFPVQFGIGIWHTF